VSDAAKLRLATIANLLAIFEEHEYRRHEIVGAILVEKGGLGPPRQCIGRGSRSVSVLSSACRWPLARRLVVK
jgi:hypothetical protein